jgi:hypothetical protein
MFRADAIETVRQSDAYAKAMAVQTQIKLYGASEQRESQYWAALRGMYDLAGTLNTNPIMGDILAEISRTADDLARDIAEHAAA